MRQSRANALDGAHQIRRYLSVDLFIARFFASTEEPIAGVVHHDIDMPGTVKRIRHDGSDRLGVRHSKSSEIGIASSRACGCQSVYISVVDGSLTKKNIHI